MEYHVWICTRDCRFNSIYLRTIDLCLPFVNTIMLLVEKKEEGLRGWLWVYVSLGFLIGWFMRTQYITSIGLFYKEMGRLWSSLNLNLLKDCKYKCCEWFDFCHTIFPFCYRLYHMPFFIPFRMRNLLVSETLIPQSLTNVQELSFGAESAQTGPPYHDVVPHNHRLSVH